MIRKIMKVCMMVLAILFIIPIAHTITNAFMDLSQINSESIELIPKQFNLTQFYKISLFKSQYFKFFMNSIKITGTIIVLQMIVSVSCAYAFAKLEFIGRNQLFLIYILLLLMPFQVTFVPNFLMMEKINTLFKIQILDTHWAIILPGVFSSLGVFLLRQFIIDIPKTMIEAARIDGASEWMIFFRIVLPSIRPAVITLIVLTFIDSWNVIEQAIVFIDTIDLMPLSVFMETIYHEDFAVYYGGALLFIFPAMYLFGKFEKYLEEGFNIGGDII